MLPPLLQRCLSSDSESAVGMNLSSCHFYWRVEKAPSQAAGRRSAVTVPSVPVLPTRILPLLDVPLPFNQDKEVVNVKGAVMENTLSSLKSCQKL